LKGSLVEARKYALKLLNYRSRSKKEMFERLKRRGFDDEQINNTLEFLEKAGLIKDEALAPGLFRNAIEKRCLGRRGIEMFLYKRGIERELINETLSSHTREMEEGAALRLVEKKLKTLKNYPRDVVKRRLCGMLQRRGFSSDTIKMIIRKL
jgi:regulatory protein